MSEAKSLVVWLSWDDAICGTMDPGIMQDRFGSDVINSRGNYEYAHDLSGRFLGVFREVKP